MLRVQAGVPAAGAGGTRVGLRVRAGSLLPLPIEDASKGVPAGAQQRGTLNVIEAMHLAAVRK